MSPIRFLANTVLPAPMKTIFGGIGKPLCKAILYYRRGYYAITYIVYMRRAKLFAQRSIECTKSTVVCTRRAMSFAAGSMSVITV
jgi:hypothetical protein